VSATLAAVHAEERDAEVGQEELHQQRRALEELHVKAHGPADRLAAAQPQKEQQRTHDAAAYEGDEREHDSPAQCQQQVAQDVPK